VALRTDPELDVRLAAADALRNYKDLAAAEGLADQVEASSIALAHACWVNLRYMTGQDLPRAVAPWREFLASSEKPFKRYGHPPPLPQGRSQRPHMTQGVGDFVKDLFKQDPSEAELK
jgi:HEAT repeat protein